jgi:hypothetical protein
MIPADVHHFGANKTLNQSKNIGVGASLYLAKKALLFLIQKPQLVYLGQAVRQKLLVKVKTAAPENIMFDVPADPF